MLRFSCLGGPILFIAIPGLLSAQQSASWQDPSPHSVQFVAVAENVPLEVLDWRGWQACDPLGRRWEHC
jgi:hypothetical protein